MRNEQVRKAAYRKSFNSMEIFDKVGPAFDQGVKKIVEFGKGFDHGQYLWEMRTQKKVERQLEKKYAKQIAQQSVKEGDSINESILLLDEIDSK